MNEEQSPYCSSLAASVVRDKCSAHVFSRISLRLLYRYKQIYPVVNEIFLTIRVGVPLKRRCITSPYYGDANTSGDLQFPMTHEHFTFQRPGCWKSCVFSTL